MDQYHGVSMEESRIDGMVGGKVRQVMSAAGSRDGGPWLTILFGTEVVPLRVPDARPRAAGFGVYLMKFWCYFGLIFPFCALVFPCSHRNIYFMPMYTGSVKFVL